MYENKNAPAFFTAHALDSARKRGTNQMEVQMTIRSGVWRSARYDRIEAEMEFAYNNDWNKMNGLLLLQFIVSTINYENKIR